MNKAWLFLIGTISVLFVPLFIGGLTLRIEPVLVSMFGTPIMIYCAIRYEKQILGDVKQ